MFIGYFSNRHLKREAAARELLVEAATRLPNSSWPYPIVRYLRREIDLQQLFAEAKTSGWATEARTWAGIDLHLSGQDEEAMSCFRWVRDHGDHDYREYELALRHLALP